MKNLFFEINPFLKILYFKIKNRIFFNLIKLFKNTAIYFKTKIKFIESSWNVFRKKVSIIQFNNKFSFCSNKTKVVPFTIFYQNIFLWSREEIEHTWYCHRERKREIFSFQRLKFLFFQFRKNWKKNLKENFKKKVFEKSFF